MPRVSVCIPSYQYLKIAETINAVLAQTFTDWELLIEDDGSNDGTAELLAEMVAKLADHRITLRLKDSNEGQNKTTNNLVARATGDYLCLLPCDDLIAPEKLAKQVAYLDANPACGIVFSWPRFASEDGRAIDYGKPDVEEIANMPRRAWQARLRCGNCLFIATSMYRRALHAELGAFDESLHLLADLEWYVRIVKKYDLHVMQEPLATITVRDKGANLSFPTAATMERNWDELDRIRATHYPLIEGRRKYMIATPFYDVKGFSPYIRSLVTTIHALVLGGIDYEFLEISGDSYVWRARNLLAQRFLDSDCTDLIFIDSDEGWTLESFLRLLKHEEEVVGCAYPIKNNWHHYGVTIFCNDDGTPRVDPKTGLIPAQKVPTGFMKIRRSAFEKIKANEPDDWLWEKYGDVMRKQQNYFGHLIVDHVGYGEDISFNIRCHRALITLWVEPRADIEHIGTQVWAGNYHKFLCEQPGGSADPKRAVNDSKSSEAA